MVAAVLTALPEHFLAKLSYYWRRSSRLSRSETLVLLTAKLSALPERNSRTTDGEALGSPGAKLSYYWRRSSRLSRSETLVLTAKLPERSLTWRRSSLSPADGDGNHCSELKSHPLNHFLSTNRNSGVVGSDDLKDMSWRQDWILIYCMGEKRTDILKDHSHMLTDGLMRWQGRCKFDNLFIPLNWKLCPFSNKLRAEALL